MATTTLMKKELEALLEVVEKAELGMVEIEEYRENDIGWLRATIRPSQGPGNHSHGVVPRVYKISPLGHVYDAKGNVVRDGGIPK